MGRDVLIQVKYLKLIFLLSSLCVPSAACLAQSTERSLLLVAGQQTQTGSFTNAELRKIFLGVAVTRNGIRIKPLLNATDTLATNVFLQQIVFMSEREYKRQLLSRVFRLGDQRPQEFDDFGLLVDALRTTPGSLTFMWSDQFEQHTGLESLGVLWVSSSD